MQEQNSSIESGTGNGAGREADNRATQQSQGPAVAAPYVRHPHGIYSFYLLQTVDQ